MELNLPFPPTPEFASKHAEGIVKVAKNVDNLELDYSVASLQAVDDVIENFRREGVAAEEIGATLFGFGCYVGEVFVRNSGAKWREASDTLMKDVAGFFLVVELESDNFCNPIGKVFKRLENGEEDNLPYFYTVFGLPPHGRPTSQPSPPAEKSWFRRLIGK